MKEIQRQKCFPVLRCSFCMIFRRQIKLSAIQPPLALEMSVDQFCSSSLLINSLTNTYLWLLQRLQTLLQMQTLYQKHPLQCWFCWICAYTQFICAGVFIKTWILLQRAWTMFSSWRRLAIFYFNALRTSHHCNCTLSNCSFHCIVRVLANLYLSSAGRAMAESWSFPSPRWPTSKLEPSTILQNAIYQTVYNFANFVKIGEQIFRC